MRSKKIAMGMIGAPTGRRSHADYYPTPPEAVSALLERESFAGIVWEPACGDGAISRVLEDAGHNVISTDLVNRGFGQAGIDFLTARRQVENIVTNPPYAMALAFVRHALECVPPGGRVAMLLRLHFLEGVERYKFFLEHPPARIYIFSRKLPWRHAVTGQVTWAMLPMAWYIWVKGYRGETVVRWICDETRPLRRTRPRKSRPKEPQMTRLPELTLREKQREAGRYTASLLRMRTTTALTKAYDSLLQTTGRPTQRMVAEMSGRSIRTVKKYWRTIRKGEIR
jgi:hypothetical protein